MEMLPFNSSFIRKPIVINYALFGPTVAPNTIVLLLVRLGPYLAAVRDEMPQELGR